MPKLQIIVGPEKLLIYRHVMDNRSEVEGILFFNRRSDNKNSTAHIKLVDHEISPYQQDEYTWKKVFHHMMFKKMHFIVVLLLHPHNSNSWFTSSCSNSYLNLQRKHWHRWVTNNNKITNNELHKAFYLTVSRNGQTPVRIIENPSVIRNIVK